MLQYSSMETNTQGIVNYFVSQCEDVLCKGKFPI